MAQGVFFFHAGKLCAVHAVKRTSGTGEKQAPDLRFVVVSHQALEDCRVLGVDGNDFRAVFFCLLHDKLARADQGFLVGKGNALFLPDGGKRGLEPDHAGHCRDDSVCLGKTCRGHETLKSQHDCYIHIRKTRL